MILASQNREVAVSLSGQLWTHVERLAAERGISVSEPTAEALTRLVEGDASYLAARERAIERPQNASSLTLDGQITWTRDELHERYATGRTTNGPHLNSA
jgi:uncharacterized protein involved in type VI secretion and phage assembly